MGETPDRQGQKTRVHVEDFAQLSGASRETKYDSSRERVIEVVDEHCTFPAVQRLELLRRTLFSFLVGNEDMHIKNFSLIVCDGKTELSPAYDLVNSTLVVPGARKELALPIGAKKRQLTRNDLLKYFALERLRLTPAARDEALRAIPLALPAWRELVERSFLPQALREKYWEIASGRADRLGLIG